jgi:hypothetical protein
MAYSQRPTRKRMEDRMSMLGLPVRHSGQCFSCGTTVNLYDDVRGDAVMPKQIVIATCPSCKAEWVISKI